MPQRPGDSPKTNMAQSNRYGDFLARSGPISTSKTYDVCTISMLHRQRRSASSALICLSLLVLCMPAISLARDDQAPPFLAKDACRCDASLPSILWRYCECVCVGASCYHYTRRLGTSQRAVSEPLRFTSRKRQRSRIRSFSSPWLIPRGGATIHEKPHLSDHQGQQQAGTPVAAQQQQQQTGTPGATQQQQQQQQRVVPLSSLPLIDTHSVSLALRLTCETNRRLYHGTSSLYDEEPPQHGRITQSAAESAVSTDALWQNAMDEQQLVPASQSPPPVIPSVSKLQLIEESGREERTVFHSPKPWEGPMPEIGHEDEKVDDDVQLEVTAQVRKTAKSRRGISRWGPDLQSYLDTLLSAIGLDELGGQSTGSKQQSSPMEDETQVILSLTLMYMDKSTSSDTLLNVDPHTGQPWYTPCPHLLPRTVHRTALAAMTIAAKFIRGDVGVSKTLREAANGILGKDDYAISESDMEQMENWMLHALGGMGNMHHQHHGMSWQVSQEEIGIFMRKWALTFYPQRLAALDQSRMKQLERFWGGQSVFGANHNMHHGHGNYWPQGQQGDDNGSRGPESAPAASLQYSSMDYQAGGDYGQSAHDYWPSPEEQHFRDHNLAQQQFYEANSEAF